MTLDGSLYNLSYIEPERELLQMFCCLFSSNIRTASLQTFLHVIIQNFAFSVYSEKHYKKFFYIYISSP